MVRASTILPAAAFLLTAALAASVEAQGRPAGVGVADVELRQLTETVPVFAEVVTVREGNIAARVSGTVDTVHVLAGRSVNAGDPLASLDTELAEIELRQAEARLSEANAGITVAQARRDRLQNALERVERLRGTNAFSAGRFDEAQGEFFQANGQIAEAEARVLSAEAAIAEVRYRIAQAEIVAPYSGVVLSVETNAGEFIASGAPVVRLLDAGALEVEASVPSRFISALTEGQKVRASSDDGATMDLEVRAILPLEEIMTRTRPVRFTAASDGALARAAVGQSITVDIPITTAREVVAVPKDALVQGPGGWTVFVAVDETAQPRPVQIGAAMDTWFEVLSGLEPGETVVIRGNERLRPGQPIAPMPAVAEAGGEAPQAAESN
ncbi:MAG: efflux RND transporter periplasmic adaptor subunit [Pseudomonadota bacterium]